MEPDNENLREQLLASNKLIQTLLETINEAVTIVDAQGIVTHWNHAAEELYNIPASEIIGRHISDFSWQSLMISRLLEQGQPVKQAYHEPRPGIHVLVNTSPVVHEDNVIGVISSEQDVTRL